MSTLFGAGGGGGKGGGNGLESTLKPIPFGQKVAFLSWCLSCVPSTFSTLLTSVVVPGRLAILTVMRQGMLSSISGPQSQLLWSSNSIFALGIIPPFYTNTCINLQKFCKNISGMKPPLHKAIFFLQKEKNVVSEHDNNLNP